MGRRDAKNCHNRALNEHQVGQARVAGNETYVSVLIYHLDEVGTLCIITCARSANDRCHARKNPRTSIACLRDADWRR